MPKNHRWAVKQRLDSVQTCLGNAQKYLIEEGAQYEALHPKHFEAFCAGVQLIEQTKALVAVLSENI